MYILIVGRGVPSKKYPLNGIFEFDQAKALSEFGHKIVYLGIDLRSIRRWRKWGIKVSKYKQMDVIQLNLPLGNIPENIFNKFGKKGFEKVCSMVLGKYGRPDIVHIHFWNIAAISVDLFNKELLPFVITEHSSQLNDINLNRNFCKYITGIYSGAKQIITVSNALRRMIYSNLNITTKVVPNIVDLEVFNYKKKVLENINNNFVFVSTGNLKGIKGFDILIRAFKNVAFRFDNCKLIIIGDGDKKNELIKLTNQQGLVNRVEFKGLLNRKQIAEIYNESNAFVLPSRSETFGVAYIEAMAAGLPVIATRCGGPEDFVNSDVGMLVRKNDVSELADAMENMILDRNKFNSQFISDYVCKKYSSKSVANQITNIYLDVLSV